MRLYSGTTKSLIEDTTYNRIATKLKDAFFAEFRHQPSVGEVNSWNNSLRAVSQVFQVASLTNHGVLLELQLPLTSKRLDCLVTGYDQQKAPNAIIIELKQWGAVREHLERMRSPPSSEAMCAMCFTLRCRLANT